MPRGLSCPMSSRFRRGPSLSCVVQVKEVLPMAPPYSPKRLWRRGVSKRAIGPDDGVRVPLPWRRKSSDKQRTTENNEPHVMDLLTSLPHEVLLSILSFLSVAEVDGSVKLVCLSLRRESASAALWRLYCERTGKLSDPVIESVETANPYRLHYYKIPCVPTDFPNITTALSRCPSGETITLLPGVYEERLEIRKSVHIRAAFPEKGAAIAWYKGVNEPCVAVAEDDIRNEKVVAELSYLQLLHSTEGSDIWGGNCAVMVEGGKSRLNLTSCCIQSDSGRGVVAVNGSFLEVKSSVIHDCAATGLYLGDDDSFANVNGCNIIRNGGGSRRPPLNDAEDSDDDDLDRVPAGHSGMYVEAGRALVENSLVAGNSLTGLSIVRGGGVIISGCDVTENGSEPILVEDGMGLEPPGPLQNRRPIGVEQGPVRNNYSSRSVDLPSLQDAMHCLVDFGGTIRKTPFHHVVVNKVMPTEAHERRYKFA